LDKKRKPLRSRDGFFIGSPIRKACRRDTAFQDRKNKPPCDHAGNPDSPESSVVGMSVQLHQLVNADRHQLDRIGATPRMMQPTETDSQNVLDV